MFPSSISAFKGFERVDGLVENSPALSAYLTRSRISLAERIQKRINRLHGSDECGSPSKGKRASRGSLISPSSKFGRDRMVQARSGRFRRPSLEAACMSAQGGDAVTFFQVPPLSSLPPPGNSSGSWEECPSLVCSPASNPEHINPPDTVSSHVSPESIPSRSSSPLSYGHIRSASHSFAREIIEEKILKIKTPVSAITLLQVNLPDVPLLDAKINNSPKGPFQEYYALKAEAETILVESQKQWTDTPYSASVVQDFQPPYDVEMMESILQESLKNYKPLPSELRHRHRSNSRISRRMSPYANSRKSKLLSSQEIAVCPSPSKRAQNMVIPKETSLLDFPNRNRYSTPTPAARPPVPSDAVNKANPHKETPKYASSLKMNPILCSPLIIRPSAPTESPLKNKSATSKTPVTKRTNNKENLCREVLKTPGGSLKVDRPRPRYRTPTPGRKRCPAKERQNVNVKDS